MYESNRNESRLRRDACAVRHHSSLLFPDGLPLWAYYSALGFSASHPLWEIGTLLLNVTVWRDEVLDRWSGHEVAFFWQNKCPYEIEPSPPKRLPCLSYSERTYCEGIIPESDSRLSPDTKSVIFWYELPYLQNKRKK